ncbi:hypothetical protein [Aquimarina litoralis]|uniref:hypothetical protein n=1 Tax=Aquimarina litoralis TaxID=584605 RepID=UPI001C591ADD|nr:hypothetical protein [Aquimarina litoralis]MBW1297397.1 hypothetical protein [Aquimarina litoralis]
MKTNNTLQWALRLCNLVLALNIIGLLIFVSTIFASIFNIGIVDHIVLEEGFKSGFRIGNFKTAKTIEDTMLLLSSISIPMKFWLMIRGIILFSITIFSLITTKKIIRSIKSLKTFYEGNIIHFKTLAKLGFIASFFSAFNFIWQEDISNVHFSIPFSAISFSVACLVLSIVFKEGKILMDDKESIV